MALLGKSQGRRGQGMPGILPRSGWTSPLVGFTSAAMAFLCVLALAASMAANSLAAQWQSDLAGVATVRFSAGGEEHDEKLRAVLEVLRTTPGIQQVRVLSDEEQAALLAPWLGEGVDLTGLPTPQLIDVSLDGEGPDAAALQQRLDLTVSGVVYDDHAAWRGPLSSAATALRWLALGAGFLVLVTSGAVVAYAARATLSANQHVIQTVRLIGAEDRFIAGEFVSGLTRRAALGSFAGAIAGCAILAMLPRIDQGDAAIGLRLSPSTTGWVILALGLPLAATLISWLASRTAVRLALSRLP